MQTNTLFINLVNIEFKTEKLILSITEKLRLSLSFSVLISMFIRVMKRVFVCFYHTVIIAKEYMIFPFGIPLFFKSFKN